MTICANCGKETKNPKFCSLSCSAKLQDRTPFIKDKSRVCLACGAPFNYKRDPQQKFCSRSCSAKLSNEGRGRPIGECLACQRKTSSSQRIFCSRKCAASHKTAKIIDKWFADPNTGTCQQGLIRPIKTYLITLAENKCSLCGWNKINPSTGRCPIEIDHIDGNCYNNAPENLRVICPNCHSLTPTYRALNRASSRTYRR